MKFLNINIFSWLAIITITAGLTSCLPETADNGLGDLAVADFTITNISTDEARNTYLLESTTNGAFAYEWDLGNGDVHLGGPVDTAYFPEKGTYTIQLTVLSGGGHSIASKDLTVEEDALTGVDVVNGGGMDDPGAWTFIGLGSTETNHEFRDEAVVFTNENPAQSNVGMYQAVELEGGRNYQFSAKVSGNGMVNSWLEVLILAEEPVEGVDPSGNVISGLNTWAGCGVNAFDGNLTSLSCIGDGVASIPASGTYFLFLKTGSWDGTLGDGLTIDDIKLIGGSVLVEGDNILAGSDMEDPSAWTVINVGLAPTGVDFADGVLRFSNGTDAVQTNIGVWQEVNIKADQIYRFSATVNDPGSTGSWIEFYLDAAVPVDGVDYTTGAITPGSTVTFSEGGTMYMLIKVGSWDGNLGPDGVTVDDVTLRELF